jgi:hypothetical protein
MTPADPLGPLLEGGFHPGEALPPKTCLSRPGSLPEEQNSAADDEKAGAVQNPSHGTQGLSGGISGSQDRHRADAEE